MNVDGIDTVRLPILLLCRRSPGVADDEERLSDVLFRVIRSRAVVDAESGLLFRVGYTCFAGGLIDLASVDWRAVCMALTLIAWCCC